MWAGPVKLAPAEQPRSIPTSPPGPEAEGGNHFVTPQHPEDPRIRAATCDPNDGNRMRGAKHFLTNVG